MILKRGLFSLGFLLLLALFLQSGQKKEGVIENYTKLISDLSVEDVLLKLGDKEPLHYIQNLNQDSVKMGYDLISTGRIKNSKNKKQSKFFVCMDCHNVIPEVSDLADESPAARIKFGKEKGIAFLPASTFYGMYNKTNWYNGDYAKKYGSLVEPTRDTLVNAIQLCATQCSQGRKMDNWEVRAILHYYKSISLQVKDLKMTSKEMDRLTKNVINKDKGGIKLLKSKFNTINDATFGHTEIPVIEGYEPNLDNGQYIFNNGCLHCHGSGNNVTNFEFDDNDLTMSFLESQISKYSHFSVPKLVRKGTYAIAGKKAYMPQYPLEKMSREQLLDLLGYISKNKSN
ncbi:MAG: c-type cytochrome [Crocinitomicaceae bacterium]